MPKKFFSSKELFALKDNAVPPFIKECLIGLMYPLEKLFKDGKVPEHPIGLTSGIPDPSTTPPYPASFEFKKDWFEWIYLEVKARLNAGIKYYNLRGEVLSEPELEDLKLPRKKKPIILFLRKFRTLSSMVDPFDEDPANVIQDVGASQVIVGQDPDTILRGKVENRFPNHTVMWIANPMDALSLSGYFTNENGILNSNSIPFVLTPFYSFQDWRESVEHLIRASDAIVFSNTSQEGGVGEEQELIRKANATSRTFVSNPENLDSSFSNVRLVDELTEEVLNELTGSDPSCLGKLAGWGQWAGIESINYAGHYINALDELWGVHLDSGKEISPDYFAALFSAMIALGIFKGQLNAAGTLGQTLAYTIMNKTMGEDIEFLRGQGKFHQQEIYAAKMLLKTSEWYLEKDETYRLVTGLSFLGG